MSQLWAFLSGIASCMFIDLLWCLPDMRVRGEISMGQETIITAVYFVLVLLCILCWFKAEHRR